MRGMLIAILAIAAGLGIAGPAAAKLHACGGFTGEVSTSEAGLVVGSRFQARSVTCNTAAAIIEEAIQESDDGDCGQPYFRQAACGFRYGHLHWVCKMHGLWGISSCRTRTLPTALIEFRIRALDG